VASGLVLLLLCRTEKIIRRQNYTFYKIHLNRHLNTLSPADGKKRYSFQIIPAVLEYYMMCRVH